jgi:hypothetical protein
MNSDDIEKLSVSEPPQYDYKRYGSVVTASHVTPIHDERGRNSLFFIDS